MTIEEFAKKKNKSLETVLLWIYQGKIPLASVDNDFIPDSARIPCPKSSAKSSGAILCSIVKASSKLMHVCANTYNICEDEFNGYVDQLIKAGLLVKRVSDNVSYLDATIEAERIKQNFILDCIERVTRGIAFGTTAAIA